MLDLPRQRERLASRIDTALGPFDPRHLEAIRRIPREQFVRPEDTTRSAEDVPLPLDDDGLATVSAPHAYLLSFRLLELAPGDRLIELGSGSGYGAALASFIVGAEGHVLTIEIDPVLAARARAELVAMPNVTPICRDAVESAPDWNAAPKIVCTFALSALPRPWLEAIPDHGILVAPVGARDAQELVRVRREGGTLQLTEHGGVRYVRNRSIAPST